MDRPASPADTRMMGIVHAALKRDLLRARDATSTVPYPDPQQRRALGEHVVWLMDFLHAHHTSEDDGLWPAVRAKNAAAGPLLDSLTDDHQMIEPAAAALRCAGNEYATSERDDARVALLAAIDALVGVLFPHLDREVEEAMPVVSATLSDGEWRAIEQKYNIKPKSLTQLGFEGHWLLDGTSAETYDVVVHTVPAVPRFILLHGFAHSYRRRMAAVWGPSGPTAPPAAR